jgi:predicted nucleic acid-binding protein
VTAVVDTSVILVLAKIDLLQLLRDLRGPIVIPASVVAEALHDDYVESTESQRIRDAIAAGWLTVEADPDTDARFVALGRGERAVIALALAISASLVLIDDGSARRVAASAGLRVSGTVAVLAVAKREGRIGENVKLAQRLREVGFRVSADVLQAAGID